MMVHALDRANGVMPQRIVQMAKMKLIVAPVKTRLLFRQHVRKKANFFVNVAAHVLQQHKFVME